MGGSPHLRGSAGLAVILVHVDTITPRRQELLTASVVGGVAGALSGLLGVGGGIVIVPGLVLLLGMGQRRAHSTSLAAIIPIAVAGAAGYAMEGAVDWLAAALLVAGAAAGTLAGTHILRRLPDRALRVIFAAFLLAAAVTLPLEVAAAGQRAELTVMTGILVIGVGALSGVMSGLLGVGGGIVMVPSLELLLSMGPAVAKGTSLVVIIPTALVGTIRNVRAADADLGLAAVVGVTGMLFGFSASLLSVRLDPLLSAVLFGLLLLATAARLLLSARGRPVPGDQA
jgi:uncharacterized membrane protein YfcA